MTNSVGFSNDAIPSQLVLPTEDTPTEDIPVIDVVDETIIPIIGYNAVYLGVTGDSSTSGSGGERKTSDFFMSNFSFENKYNKFEHFSQDYRSYSNSRFDGSFFNSYGSAGISQSGAFLCGNYDRGSVYYKNPIVLRKNHNEPVADFSLFFSVYISVDKANSDPNYYRYIEPGIGMVLSLFSNNIDADVSILDRRWGYFSTEYDDNKFSKSVGLIFDVGNYYDGTYKSPNLYEATSDGGKEIYWDGYPPFLESNSPYANPYTYDLRNPIGAGLIGFPGAFMIDDRIVRICNYPYDPPIRGNGIGLVVNNQRRQYYTFPNYHYIWDDNDPLRTTRPVYGKDIYGGLTKYYIPRTVLAGHITHVWVDYKEDGRVFIHAENEQLPNIIPEKPKYRPPKPPEYWINGVIIGSLLQNINEGYNILGNDNGLTIGNSNVFRID